MWKTIPIPNPIPTPMKNSRKRPISHYRKTVLSKHIALFKTSFRMIKEQAFEHCCNSLSGSLSESVSKGPGAKQMWKTIPNPIPTPMKSNGRRPISHCRETVLSKHIALFKTSFQMIKEQTFEHCCNSLSGSLSESVSKGPGAKQMWKTIPIPNPIPTPMKSSRRRPISHCRETVLSKHMALFKTSFRMIKEQTFENRYKKGGRIQPPPQLLIPVL